MEDLLERWKLCKVSHASILDFSYLIDRKVKEDKYQRKRCTKEKGEDLFSKVFGSGTIS
jgi:hypothetical protein